MVQIGHSNVFLAILINQLFGINEVYGRFALGKKAKPDDEIRAGGNNITENTSLPVLWSLPTYFDSLNKKSV